MPGARTVVLRTGPRGRVLGRHRVPLLLRPPSWRLSDIDCSPPPQGFTTPAAICQSVRVGYDRPRAQSRRSPRRATARRARRPRENAPPASRGRRAHLCQPRGARRCPPPAGDAGPREPGHLLLSPVKVLVLGSGAREHAIVAALAADPAVDAVIAAPGNPGIDAIALCRDLPSGLLDGDGVADLAVEVGADLVVVGPEAPLVAGVADVVRARGIACFGPGREAAQLEGSKAFAKEVMAAAEVPTALAHVCATARRGGRRARRASARRTSSRTTGWRPARASWSPTTGPRPLAHAAAVPGRPGRQRRGRGVPRRPRGVAVLPHRRRARRPAGAGAGLQAGRRRRHRPQHRRHGRLLAAALGPGRAGRRRRRPRRPADGRRDAPPRHAVHRRPVRRAGPHLPRACG